MDLRRWILVWLCIASSSCGEPQCPDGFDKVGNSCRRQPEGGTIDPSQVDPGARDAEGVATIDGGSISSDATTAWSDGDGSASSDDARVMDATATPSLNDAGAVIGDAQVPTTECDDQRRCSAGYACESGRCASACEHKQCDANATCSLMGANAVCTCNGGFIAQGQACIRDVACEELACSRNATCEVGSDGLRRCACKNGYVGTGKTCEPVSCPPASGLSIPNGTVSTPNGATYNQTAQYACNAGFRANGATTRSCGADGMWTGMPPQCEPRDCGALTNPDHGKVDATQGTAVGSPAAKYTCDSGYSLIGDSARTCQPTLLGVGWSGAAPKCLKCGDGIVSPLELGEECDPGVKGASIWTCDPKTCRRASAYRPCLANTECDSAHTCILGYCSPACQAVQCPAPPNAQLSSSCVTSSGGSYCSLSGCNKESDCAPGLLCFQGLCTGCAIATCPLPRMCIVPTGDVSGLVPFKAGHCAM